MPRLPAKRALSTASSVLAVTCVLAIAGLLFATSARLARSDGGRPSEDLAQLTTAEEAQVDRLSGQVDALEKEITALREETEATPEAPSTAVGIAAGTVPVSGPGVSVSMADAPDMTYPPGVNPRPKDLIVHQQDVQAVVNALWAGGAEAMTLQGERVTSTSAFRCVGNTLQLHGRVFSPPYVIQAIGDPQRLRDALEASADVAAYRNASILYGLVWSVSDADRLDVPAYTGSEHLDYARPVTEES